MSFFLGSSSSDASCSGVERGERRMEEDGSGPRSAEITLDLLSHNLFMKERDSHRPSYALGFSFNHAVFYIPACCRGD